MRRLAAAFAVGLSLIVVSWAVIGTALIAVLWAFGLL